MSEFEMPEMAMSEEYVELWTTMSGELCDYIWWFREEFERNPTAAEFEADGFDFKEYSHFLLSPLSYYDPG